jgi:hypothetical protein
MLKEIEEISRAGSTEALPVFNLTDGKLEETSEVAGEPAQPETTVEESAPRDQAAVAIWLGMKLELPSGRSFAFLMCSANQDGEGILAEGVRGPSEDEKEHVIHCSRCDEPHCVVSLADAIAENLLGEIDDAVSCIQVREIVALTLLDFEGIAKKGKAANLRSA